MRNYRRTKPFNDGVSLSPSDLPATVILEAVKDLESDKYKEEAEKFLQSDFALWYAALLDIYPEHFRQFAERILQK